MEGTTDITRTFHYGEPTDSMKQRYTEVLLGSIALASLTLPDKTLDTSVDLATRQFLFRQNDVGRFKAEVAAEFINKRIPGCRVSPHNCKIQDFDEDFYRGFHLVVCGLDSIVARRWINGMLISMLEYDDDGELDKSTILPLIDGGTEGFKVNIRVVVVGLP